MRPYASRGAGTSPYSIPSIWAYSGHYRPSEENLNNFLSSLREKRAHTSSNGYYYADPKLDQADKVIKSMTSREPRQPKMPLKIEKSPIVEPSAVSETEASVKGDEGANGSYKSTLSGGLQSQRADVPQKVILDRIKLKREARLYQLGNQLSMKWCTGAGPRIGCVADYPVELRMQALELVNLSPT